MSKEIIVTCDSTGEKVYVECKRLEEVVSSFTCFHDMSAFCIKHSYSSALVTCIMDYFAAVMTQRVKIIIA